MYALMSVFAHFNTMKYLKKPKLDPLKDQREQLLALRESQKNRFPKPGTFHSNNHKLGSLTFFVH